MSTDTAPRKGLAPVCPPALSGGLSTPLLAALAPGTHSLHRAAWAGHPVWPTSSLGCKDGCDPCPLALPNLVGETGRGLGRWWGLCGVFGGKGSGEGPGLGEEGRRGVSQGLGRAWERWTGGHAPVCCQPGAPLHGRTVWRSPARAAPRGMPGPRASPARLQPLPSLWPLALSLPAPLVSPSSGLRSLSGCRKAPSRLLRV